MRKRLKALTIGALTAAATFAGSTSAFASAPIRYTNNNCGISETEYYTAAYYCNGGLQLFYHANFNGTSADIVGDITNLSADPTYAYEGSTLVLQYYTDYEFWDMAGIPPQGEYQAIRNNVGSVWNSSTTHSYTLYVSPNYTGHTQTFGPSAHGNLNSYLSNNEASIFES
jgi:hypothetical protein